MLKNYQYDEFGYDIKGVNKYGDQKKTSINDTISEKRKVHSNNIEDSAGFLTDTKLFDLLQNKKEEEIKQYNFTNIIEANNLNLEGELSKIIGLEDIKNIIRNQYKILLAQEKRKKAGVIVKDEQTLNMLF